MRSVPVAFGSGLFILPIFDVADIITVLVDSGRFVYFDGFMDCSGFGLSNVCHIFTGFEVQIASSHEMN